MTEAQLRKLVKEAVGNRQKLYSDGSRGPQGRPAEDDPGWDWRTQGNRSRRPRRPVRVRPPRRPGGPQVRLD